VNNNVGSVGGITSDIHQVLRKHHCGVAVKGHENTIIEHEISNNWCVAKRFLACVSCRTPPILLFARVAPRTPSAEVGKGGNDEPVLKTERPDGGSVIWIHRCNRSRDGVIQGFPEAVADPWDRKRQGGANREFAPPLFWGPAAK
jgi:hypothetical protein